MPRMKTPTPNETALMAVLVELMLALEDAGALRPEQSAAVIDTALERTGAQPRAEAFVAFVGNALAASRARRRA